MTHAVQATLPYFTNLPRDVVTNTWHFDWTGAGSPLGTDYTALANEVELYYERLFTVGGSYSVASWINISAFGIKIYDLSDPTPRVPKFMRTSALAVDRDGGTSLPPEAAVCLSYKAIPTPGISLASQRGRIYLGGLGSTTTVPGTTSTFVTPATGFLAKVGDEAKTMLIGAGASDWNWVVWSQKLQTSFPVWSGWVDNAFDTQRRRGNSATGRDTWSM